MLVTFLAALYLVLFAYAFFYGEKAMFYPPPASYRDTPEVIKLATADGVRISARYFPNPAAKYTILFSHGNAEDIGHNQPFFEALRAAGFSVFAYDYRGYGTSEGAPSEQGVYRDEAAAYDYLVSQLKTPPERIIAHGRSVGAGAAIDLAARQPLAGLIIESGFTSAYRIVTRWPILPLDRFPNLRKMREVRCPVLVIHGADDEVIAYHHGVALYGAARGPKQLYRVPGARHNDLFDVAGEGYFTALRAFTDLLDSQPAERRPEGR